MRMEFLWLALIVVFAVIEGATTALTHRLVHRRRTAARQPPCCMPSSAADHAVLCRVCRTADCAAPAS